MIVSVPEALAVTSTVSAVLEPSAPMVAVKGREGMPVVEATVQVVALLVIPALSVVE